MKLKKDRGLVSFVIVVLFLFVGCSSSNKRVEVVEKPPVVVETHTVTSTTEVARTDRDVFKNKTADLGAVSAGRSR
jgi:uncharacterized protein YcfL